MSFQYQVRAIVPLAPQVSSLLLMPLVPTKHLSYQSGQYLCVVHADGQESPLSIANAPRADGELELQLSHVPGNALAHDILTMAKTGTLTIRGAFGQCTVARFSLTRPLLFVVRGTGFAPVKALLEALATQPACPPLHVYWGVATEADFYGVDALRRAATVFADFQLTLKVSRSLDQHQLHHAVVQDFPDMHGVEVYASGGVDMVLAALAQFERHGLPRAQFYSDVLP